MLAPLPLPQFETRRRNLEQQIVNLREGGVWLAQLPASPHRDELLQKNRDWVGVVESARAHLMSGAADESLPKSSCADLPGSHPGEGIVEGRGQPRSV